MNELTGTWLDPDTAPTAQLILLSRIYDVQLALLKLQSPDIAKGIEDAHAAGMLFGPAPSFVGHIGVEDA